MHAIDLVVVFFLVLLNGELRATIAANLIHRRRNLALRPVRRTIGDREAPGGRLKPGF